MPATRILLADRDEKARTAISRALSSEGYDVAVAGDGQEAFVLAQKGLPEALVLDPSLPRMDGLSLVRTLRSRPEFALVPAIFMAPPAAVEPRMSGFRIGADDFIPKPFDTRQLAARLKAALGIAEASRKMVQSDEGKDLQFSAVMAGFRGDLDQVGLPSLLTLLELERKTGMLVLILAQERDKARIMIRDGRVLSAHLDTAPEPRNADLIYLLLSRGKGRFDFRPRAVVTSDEINLPTTQLLLEGARQLDETRKREQA